MLIYEDFMLIILFCMFLIVNFYINVKGIEFKIYVMLSR